LLFELLLREFFDFGLMQTDPNPANFLYDAARDELVLLDFGATREVPAETSDLYRRAFRGIEARDRPALRRVLLDLGLQVADHPELAEALIDLALVTAYTLEPGPFDFRATDLSARLHEKAHQLRAFRDQLKDLGPPPPAYLFFQRKLGGTFLLCRNLGAVFDGREVLERLGVLDPHPSRRTA
jgi:hypothetical protein